MTEIRTKRCKIFWFLNAHWTSNVTTVTKVRSASFRLVLHAHHIFANSFNFFVIWGLSVTIFHSMCIFCVYRMALYWPTLQFSLSVRIVCQYVLRPLVSVITTLYYTMLHVCMLFHWIAQTILNEITVRASSSYIFDKFHFFRGFRCWASPRRNIACSVNHSPSLFDAPETEACASEWSFGMTNK